MVSKAKAFGTPSTFGNTGWPWYNESQFSQARFVKGGVVNFFHFGISSMELPQDMLDEIERLKESPERIQSIARKHNLEMARRILDNLSEKDRLFNKWFPILKDFEQAKRAAAPTPSESELTATDRIVQRILLPKIGPPKPVPLRSESCAAFFTAPLSVLSFLKLGWPSSYPNAVFLTPDELTEWRSQYEYPYDAYWWFHFQNWTIEFDPPSDSIWLNGSIGPERRKYEVPDGATTAIATWGSSSGSLASSIAAELWCIENGVERCLGDLGFVVS